MLRRLKPKSILTAALLMIVPILFIQSSCAPEEESGPVANGTTTGAWNRSPEDSTVGDLANEFASSTGQPIRLIFSNRSINGFIEDLENTTAIYNHVDFLGFLAEDIDRLIETGWITPYSEQIDISMFSPAAIEAMNRNDILYGIPLFETATGIVKGVGISAAAEPELRLTALSFLAMLALGENMQKLAAAAGGTSVENCLNFQTIDPFPQYFDSATFAFSFSPLYFINPTVSGDPMLISLEDRDLDSLPELWVEFSSSVDVYEPFTIEFPVQTFPGGMQSVSVELMHTNHLSLIARDNQGAFLDSISYPIQGIRDTLQLNGPGIRDVQFNAAETHIYKICWSN
ncbi:MAG: hypothetical protein JSU85_13370 [Candidatus Zixiibacteriota bacterium]|nr:MAG: hypothetical protein JSU85_13370 [candidate division Zixibacteria bacterium]